MLCWIHVGFVNKRDILYIPQLVGSQFTLGISGDERHNENIPKMALPLTTGSSYIVNIIKVDLGGQDNPLFVPPPTFQNI